MVTLKCLECSKEFEAQRSSAKFCSTKCRVDYNRRSEEEKETKVVEEFLKTRVSVISEPPIAKNEIGIWDKPESEVLIKEEPPKPEKIVLPKAKGIILGADYLADVPKTTFQKLLIQFNLLVEEQPPVKDIEVVLYDLIEKSIHPDLTPRQCEAIRERCINYLTGQYGTKSKK